MSQIIRYVGFDTSKETIAVAIADQDGSVVDHGAIHNDPGAIRKLIERLGHDGSELRVAYEAGPTGYAIHRQLTALGISCMVVAPSLIPHRPGDRVKTDRRDANQLARLLRSGDLVAVWVPDEAHEALRDLVRTRDDARSDLLRAKHRLGKMLIRRGVTAPPSVGRAWSAKHQAWLNTVTFGDAAAQVSYDDYLAQIRGGIERIRRLDAALLEAGSKNRHAAVVRALQALRGVGYLTAVTIVAEAGDLRRFESAGALMAYAGMVPSEHSSGGSTRRGHLTKTGNHGLRRVVGESAHHSRLQPRVSPTLRARQEGLPPAVIAISWKCQQRLHHKYRHLAMRIGTQRALSAVGRELLGFVWAIGQAVEVTAPA